MNALREYTHKKIMGIFVRFWLPLYLVFPPISLLIILYFVYKVIPKFQVKRLTTLTKRLTVFPNYLNPVHYKYGNYQLSEFFNFNNYRET